MDTMKNVVLRAVDLHKSYAGKLALKGVSIDLREGEFVALLDVEHEFRLCLS